jgi:hypothetical protein
LGSLFSYDSWNGEIGALLWFWIALILLASVVTETCLRERPLSDLFVVLAPLLLVPSSDLLASYVVLATCWSAEAIAQSRWKLALVAAGLMALSLCKFTLWIESALALALLTLAVYRYHSKRYLYAWTLSLPVMLVIAWTLAQQQLVDLPIFLQRSAELAKEYSGAMGLEGPASEVWVGTVLLGFLGVQVLAEPTLRLLKTRSSYESLFPMARGFAVIALGYLVFKHGFVRHDGHVFTYAAFIAPALQTARGVDRDVTGVPRRLMAGAHSIALVASLYLVVGASQTRHEPPGGLLEHALAQLGERAQEFRSVFDTAGRRARFQEGLAKVRSANPLPSVDGRVDIASNNISAVLAHGLRWAPRPVFQSYAAYTKKLAEANRSYVADSATGPAHFFVQLETLDARVPLQEDPYLWPELLTKYEVASFQGIAHLKRRPLERPTRRADMNLTRDHDGWGMPRAEYDFATVRVRPARDVRGWMRGILFKPAPIRMLLDLADGSRRAVSFIVTLADVAFIVSPLIETTDEFVQLAQSYVAIRHKRVTRIQFTDAVGRRLELDDKPKLTTFKFAEEQHPGRVLIVKGHPDVYQRPEWEESGRRFVNAHAPTLLTYEPPHSDSFEICYGVRPDAWGHEQFDGVHFTVSLDAESTPLLDRILAPNGAPTKPEECRQLHVSHGARLLLETGPNGTTDYDWAYWRVPSNDTHARLN